MCFSFDTVEFQFWNLIHTSKKKLKYEAFLTGPISVLLVVTKARMTAAANYPLKSQKKKKQLHTGTKLPIAKMCQFYHKWTEFCWFLDLFVLQIIPNLIS